MSVTYVDVLKKTTGSTTIKHAIVLLSARQTDAGTKRTAVSTITPKSRATQNKASKTIQQIPKRQHARPTYRSFRRVGAWSIKLDVPQSRMAATPITMSAKRAGPSSPTRWFSVEMLETNARTSPRTRVSPRFFVCLATWSHGRLAQPHPPSPTPRALTGSARGACWPRAQPPRASWRRGATRRPSSLAGAPRTAKTASPASALSRSAQPSLARGARARSGRAVATEPDAPPTAALCRQRARSGALADAAPSLRPATARRAAR